MRERRELTIDERAVAKLIAEGFDTLDIAERLGLSVYRVQHRIRYGAEKLEGRGSPTIKLCRWWCLVGMVQEQAAREALERAA